MTRSMRMLSATLVLGAGFGWTGVATAADDATLNKCWGQATKHFAPMGDHSSSPPGVEPGEGRRGVGNVSKEDHGDPLVNGLGDGAQGKHAIAVAPDEVLEAMPEECQEIP